MLKRSFNRIYQEWNFNRDYRPIGEVDCVEIIVENENDDFIGEFSVTWISLVGKVYPQLESLSDGWMALAAMPDFIALLNMQNGKDISADDFCKRLLALGFVDTTQRTNPNPPPRFRVTYDEPRECCDDPSVEITSEIPAWAQAVRTVVLDPEFISLEITYETQMLKIERFREDMNQKNENHA